MDRQQGDHIASRCNAAQNSEIAEQERWTVKAQEMNFDGLAPTAHLGDLRDLAVKKSPAQHAGGAKVAMTLTFPRLIEFGARGADSSLNVDFS